MKIVIIATKDDKSSGKIPLRIKHDIVGVNTLDDKPIGSIGLCVSGGIELNMGDNTYYVSPNELWSAFQTKVEILEAMEEPVE